MTNIFALPNSSFQTLFSDGNHPYDILITFGPEQNRQGIYLHRHILAKNSVYFRHVVAELFPLASSSSLLSVPALDQDLMEDCNKQQTSTVPTFRLDDSVDPLPVKVFLVSLYSQNIEDVIDQASSFEVQNPSLLLSFYTDLYFLGEKYQVEEVKKQALEYFYHEAVTILSCAEEEGDADVFVDVVRGVLGPAARVSGGGSGGGCQELENMVLELCVEYEGTLRENGEWIFRAQRGELFDCRWEETFLRASAERNLEKKSR